MQLRVFRFRSDENRNVRVRVFPKREEILIGCLHFGGVALQCVGTGSAGFQELGTEKVADVSGTFRRRKVRIPEINLGSEKLGTQIAFVVDGQKDEGVSVLEDRLRVRTPQVLPGTVARQASLRMRFVPL